MSQTARHITISGAGLVGSLLALALGRRGYKVDVFESRPDMRKVEIPAGRSINLALANRGILPLKQAGVMDEVAKLLIPMRGRMIHPVAGELHLQPYGQRPEEVVFSVSRPGLNMLLLEAAEKTGNVTLHFEHAAQSVDFETKQLTVLAPSGERVVSYDLLFGTDGAGSPVRRAMESAGHGTFDEEPLGHAYKELCIPGTADGQFQMENGALHIWPRGGYMLIALPNLDGSFTVTLFLPNEGAASFEALDTGEKVTAFFKQQFPDALALIPSLVDDFFGNPTGRLATLRGFPWTVGSDVLLLGDAAHAIVPFHGQGMNAGFEDVGALIDTLDAHKRADGSDDWETVIPKVAELRKPNGDAIAQMAIENYVEMRDSVRDPRFLLKKELGFLLEKRHPKTFIPRYSMVMFHSMPYATALSRGEVQDAILNELTEGLSDLEACDLEKADELIAARLSPIL